MTENYELVIDESINKVPHILTEVLVGLSKRQKTIPPKFLYDKRGSEIFEQICELEDYYPTRSENLILSAHSKQMASLIGKNALVIEPGSGSGEKVRPLLKCLKNPAGYVPIEISREILLRMTDELNLEFPRLKVHPVLGDFTDTTEIPASVDSETARKIIFFPGSTIGNFNPQEAVDFLKRYAKIIGTDGALIIGADVKKDHDLLVRAYNDSEGVTAAFNLNLLERLNRETDASFEPDNFYHHALYNEELGRVEMHLVSKVSQMVQVNQTVFRFNEGETIHTENSYKYSQEEFADLCSKARLVVRKSWQDPEKLFCVYYIEKEKNA
ncbi:MAG TPA: L-histidine N(alpha)-methyltransferase [Bacteriovoracaceae bacterium]|nr:L-histidine N(alpha)-methyltransferase [Bacteriovoracaceae bacterium]